MTGKPTKQLTIVLGFVEYGDTFLLLRRVDKEPQWNGKWELPGGKIKPHETPEQAMIREIHEETGLAVENCTLLDIYTHIWDVPEFIQQTIIILYRAQASHQQISLEDGKDAFQWVTLDEFFQIENHLGTNRMMVEQHYAPVYRVQIQGMTR